MNAQFRKALHPRGHFPSDEAVFKVLFLAIKGHQARGRSPKEWGQALGHFNILFEDRFPAA